MLLRRHDHPKDGLTRLLDGVFGWFFRGFNRFFGASSRGYAAATGGLLKRRILTLGVYAILIACTWGIFQKVPQGFVPVQDKQYLVSFAQLPQGATLERSEEVIRKMSEIALKEPGVTDAVAFPGLSINGFISSPSAGIVFVTLDDFENRKTPDLSGLAIAGKLQQKFMGIDEAFIAIFPPPPVQGLGTVGGFKLQILDRTDQGYQALDNTLKQVLGKAWQTPELTSVFSSYNVNMPQLFANLDRTRAAQLGINVDEVFRTMQTYLGSIYINDFNQFGRTYQVIAQADAQFRAKPEDITRLKTRNAEGEMVPLGSVVTVEETYGPEAAARYNGLF